MTTDQRVNYCLYSGALVGDGAAVPTDPTLFATQGVRTRPRLGCANLVCRDCGAAVRRSAGRTLIANTVDSAALYAAEDWADGVLTTTSSDMGALYTCRCKTEWTSNYLYLSADPRDSYDGVIRPPWGCDGHPVLTLPVEIDSVTISVETDLDALVRRVLGGWSPPSALAPKQNEAWLALLYQRLRGLAQADALARAMGACVAHADPYVRGGALHFFKRYPFAPGYLKALAAAVIAKEGQLPFYETSHIPWSKRTESTLVISEVVAAHFDEVERDDPRMTALLDMLKGLLLRPAAQVNDEMYRRVGYADPQWISGHVSALIEAHPETWPALISAVRAAGVQTAQTVGQTIIDSELVDREELRAWFAENLLGFGWADTLREVLGVPLD